ncbi:MAG: hypothetical protein ACXVW6_04895 [Nocardioidaceae bacterium]
MRTRLTTLLVAAGIIAWTATGCAQQDPGRSSPAYPTRCPHPTKHELGFVRSAEGPWPSFRTTGGEVYVGVRGLEQDTALGPVRLTRMSLVDLEQEPRFREGTSVVFNASLTADVRPKRLTKVRVPAGHYRVVSSNYGNLWLETCAAGRVSDVQVAQPATDAP